MGALFRRKTGDMGRGLPSKTLLAESAEVELQNADLQCRSHLGEHKFDERADRVPALNSRSDKPPCADGEPGVEVKEPGKGYHQGEIGTACCRTLPSTADDAAHQGESGGVTTTSTPTGGRYGVIFLFDGVSTVILILKKKFGYPPVAAILAECDLSLRELVCTEFRYRSDEKWGHVQDGSAVLYLKDVHAVIKGNCKLLQELVQMFSHCKWVIVGGSPCQDFTFAGSLRGMLGLIGPSSRLFFVLLCVIYAMQQVVGPAAVRY